jgi:hypothetical protein
LGIILAGEIAGQEGAIAGLAGATAADEHEFLQYVDA